MKLRFAPLALLPLLAAAAPAPAVNLPDLIIVSVSSPNYDSGIVHVQVKNQGTAPAGPSSLSVQLSGLATGTTTVSVGAIGAGATIIVTVNTGKGLSGVSYLVTADPSNVVTESSERNNTMGATFGGKP